MSRRSTAMRSDEGFTLLELLVTLAVISFISTIIFGAIFTTRNIARRLVADESAQAEVAAVQTILRSKIEGMRAVPRPDRAMPVIDVVGDQQRIGFYGTSIASNPSGGLQAFRLVRTATGDLVLFSAPSLTEDLDLRSPSIDGWNRTRLLAGVEEINISYFGPTPGESGASWQRFWGESPQPPMLVRIGVKFADGDRRTWPELILRPRATVNMACRFDVVTSRCSDVVG
jgi:general secretion pathway protein J